MSMHITADQHIDTVAAKAPAVSSGFFARLYAAIIASRQRAAEREIERYIALHGGQLTDEMERNISRRFGSSAGL